MVSNTAENRDHVPAELDDAIDMNANWEVGQTVRVTHLECSQRKANPNAMAIIKKVDGYYMHCFRCGYKGWVGNKLKSPIEMQAQLKAMEKTKQFETHDVISLPHDCVPMTTAREGHVPWVAYQWGWTSELDGNDMEVHEFQWSPSYQRVIVPIYEWSMVGKVMVRKLVGWVGREVLCRNKKVRENRGIAKYITRKSSEYDRIFFHAPHPTSDTYVLVEDILSAIRVSKAAKVNAIALLTTSVPTKVLVKLRKKKVIIWLDFDVLDATMKYFRKANALSIDARYIRTTKDPKGYTDQRISSYINGRKKDVSMGEEYVYRCIGCQKDYQLHQLPKDKSCPQCYRDTWKKKPGEPVKIGAQLPNVPKQWYCKRCDIYYWYRELMHDVKENSCPVCGENCAFEHMAKTASEVMSERKKDWFCSGCAQIISEEEIVTDHQCPVCNRELDDTMLMTG
jgi:DNA-directed RNA polymerase subunit RPC12/RpoP